VGGDLVAFHLFPPNGCIPSWSSCSRESQSALHLVFAPQGRCYSKVAASHAIFIIPLEQVSGVPPLERAGEKKFAGNPKWEYYKR